MTLADLILFLTPLGLGYLIGRIDRHRARLERTVADHSANVVPLRRPERGAS